MPGIFISYRRDDSAAIAGRMYDRLSRHFGKDKVFRDIDTIDPGADFGKAIADRIAACDALIALIGKEWLGAKDAEGRRRLDQPRDFVRAEIAEALAQNKLVIPALIEGATMPTHEALPPEMATLADRNALPISDSRFDYDVGRLIKAIEKAVVARAGETTAAPRKNLWVWMYKAQTQRTLAFFGAGLAAVLGAGWTAYVHFSTKPESAAVTASQAGIAAGGNVSVTASGGGVAVVATGPVTIGITLAEYLDKLKKREQELRAEFASTNKADKEKIALLEAELKDVEAKAKSLADAFEKYKQVFASASQSLVRIAPEVPDEEREKALQALARGESSEAERFFENVLGAEKQRAAEAAYQIGKLAESRIDYAKADKYYLEAVKLQPDNAQYLDAAGRIAYTLGRYADARPLLERALAIPDHPDRATSLTNLALLYKALGLYAKAQPLYQQALAIRKKSPAPDHSDVAASLNNLAALYLAQGLYAKAEPLYEESLAIRKKSPSPDPYNVATSLNNLAWLYYTQGLYTKAETLYQEALAILKKSLGSDHPQVAASLNNLAALYWAQSLYAKAEPLYQESLAILKKSLGPDHPDVATSLNNLAELYYTQGLYAKAEPLYQESLAIFKKSLVPNHALVAASLNNLAALYRAQGIYAKAEPLYAESLAILKKSLGPDHPDVATSLDNLAGLYATQSFYAKAEQLYRESLAISKESLGPDHPDVAKSLNNLAGLYYAQGLYARAAPLYEEALAILKKSLTPDHPNVATSLENYARLLTKLKRDKEAAEMQSQAKEIRARLARQ